MDIGASSCVRTGSAVSGTFHHVFALDSYFGRYLGHVSDASGSLCLVAVSYLDICVSCLFHVLISLCGLMDTYDWTIAYVSHSS